MGNKNKIMGTVVVMGNMKQLFRKIRDKKSVVSKIISRRDGLLSNRATRIMSEKRCSSLTVIKLQSNYPVLTNSLNSRALSISQKSRRQRLDGNITAD